MYCDHNATSPMSAAVKAAVGTAMETAWANPGSPHRLGQNSAVQVEKARHSIGALMGVASKHVFFTSGATEANAWVLSSAAERVIVSAVEHPSVLAWADETVSVDAEGLIDLDELEERLKLGPAVVSVMAANNETGVLQPICEVADLCAQYGAHFHCDATQVPGRMKVDINAHWITVSAHKMGGPRGVGALITSNPPQPLLRGGEQERGQRAGTLNVPGIVGFGQAVRELGLVSATERDKLEAFCESAGAKILGKTAPRLPNTVSALFNAPGDLIVAALDLRGVHASTGSACSSGSHQASHVLTAMGLSGTPVRFSFGHDTKAEPIIASLEAVLKEMEAVCA